MKKLISSLLVVLFMSTVAFAGSKTITLQWDYANPPTDLAGFRLYASVSSGTYTYGSSSVDMIADIAYVDGQLTYQEDETLTVSDGEESTYYFVATAYDSTGNESGPSNEATYTVDFEAPHVIINLQLNTQ